MTNLLIYKGELAILASAAFWAFAMVMFKLHGRDWSAEMINFVKVFVAFIFLIIMLMVMQPVWSFNSNAWGWMVFSGCIGLALGDNTLLLALQKLGAQTSSLFLLLIPPLTVVLGFYFLNETLTLNQIVGVFITIFAVGGALLFARRGNKKKINFSRDAYIGFIAGALTVFFQAIGVVSSRLAMVDLDIFVGTFIRVVSALFFLTIYNYIFFVYKNSSQPKFYSYLKLLKSSSFYWICFASFVGSALGLTFLSIATKYAKAGVVSALASTTPLWILPLAFWLLKEKIKTSSVAFTFVAIAGVYLVFNG